MDKCDNCFNLLWDVFKCSLDKLIISSSECLGCLLLVSATNTFQRDFALPIMSLDVTVSLNWGEGLRLQFHLEDGSMQGWYEILKENDKDDFRNYSYRMRTVHCMSGDPGSDTALDWAVQRFTNCDSTHMGCSVDRPILPTRVLDLGLANDTDDSTQHNLRLHIAQSDESAKYACLSYCWGSAADTMPLRTTMATVEQYQNEIKFSELPRTFQDAVVFTRRLGIRYLWIDSLCIVQDDEQDWRREASRMASVFGNSSLSLAALFSKNSHEGLFTSTGPLQVLPMSGLGFIPTPDCDQNFFIWKIGPEGTHKAFSSSFRNLSAEMPPLFQRGWVYQERLLALRTLTFAQGEMVWECHNQLQCECSGALFKESVLKAGGSRKLTVSRSRRPELFWYDLVEEFSDLSFTKQTDKLIALAGLANKVELRCRGFHGESTDTYGHGIWENSILEGLVWYSVLPSSRLGHSVAPTWSWASVNSPVEFYKGREDLDYIGRERFIPLCTIEHFGNTLEQIHDQKDPTLGELTLSGLVLPAVFQAPVSTPPNVYNKANVFFEEYRVLQVQSILQDGSYIMDHDSRDEIEQLILNSTENDTPDEALVFILPVARNRNIFYSLVLIPQPMDTAVEEIDSLLNSKEAYQNWVSNTKFRRIGIISAEREKLKGIEMFAEEKDLKANVTII